MPQKRKYKLENFLEVLSIKSLSTGVIARKLKCCSSTALRSYVQWPGPSLGIRIGILSGVLSDKI